MTSATAGPVLVVVPTYDEIDNIAGVVARVHEAVPTAHVLVVDDASPDGTGALADLLARDRPYLHVLHRRGKEGLGAAYREGFRWGLDRGYEVVVEMDADGSHRPEQLPLLLERLGTADVVLGSRWVPGGSVVDWPRRREVLSRGGNLYVRVALGLPLRDATGGYRAYRREVLEAVDLDRVGSQGYCFQVDMARRAVRAGFHVAEVPITFVERVAGTSKMSGAIVREALVQVTLWGLRDLLGGERAGRGADAAPTRCADAAVLVEAGLRTP